MFDPKFFDELAQQLSESIPENLRAMCEDLEHTFKFILQNAFAKLDLVTRDEFDTQSKVLIRTRERLEHLEKKLTAFEKDMHAEPKKKHAPKAHKKKSD